MSTGPVNICLCRREEMVVSAQGRWWGSSSFCVNSVKQTVAMCSDGTLSARLLEGSYRWPWPPDSISMPFRAASSEQAAFGPGCQLFTSLCCPPCPRGADLGIAAGAFQFSPKSLRIKWVNCFHIILSLLVASVWQLSAKKLERWGRRYTETIKELICPGRGSPKCSMRSWENCPKTVCLTWRKLGCWRKGKPVCFPWLTISISVLLTLSVWVNRVSKYKYNWQTEHSVHLRAHEGFQDITILVYSKWLLINLGKGQTSNLYLVQ